ncbi:MAG: glycosyltransferase [Sphingobacteriales bacterium]|nr:glycosyltransferase [Sphingobacteriales bacterium]
MKTHIVFTVINDLTYDQRMNRICNSLAKGGFKVTLIGRKLPHSLPLEPKSYNQKRFKLWFEKGKLFYLEYNLRLLLHLLFTKYDIYGATDLDTLVPQFLAAKLKSKPHTYDAHEYFAELPEIVHRPLVKWVWKTVERLIVPRTQYCYTINQTYARLFEQTYNKHFEIVRNATVLHSALLPTPNPKYQQATERYILYQGAVNVGRGLEEMIQAMPQINCQLYICGKGDVYNDCVALVEKLDLTNKVKFFGWVEPHKLLSITQNATLGFTFFTNNGDSYYYSLANRFFDYFHNGVPQLCVDFPEYRAINQQFEIALLLPNLKIDDIAKAANLLLNQPDYYNRLRNNCLAARQVYNWQEEERKLITLYKSIPVSQK